MIAYCGGIYTTYRCPLFPAYFKKLMIVHDSGNNYKPQRIENTVVIAAFLVDTSK